MADMQTLEDILEYLVGDGRGNGYAADGIRAQISARDRGESLQQMYTGGSAAVSRGNAERDAARKPAAKRPTE